MNNKGFIVLQGDNPYTDMDNDPAYFRGRFATYEEAITGCEDIFRRDFERLEKMAIAEGFSWKDLDSYLFVYYYPPWIRNPWDRPAGVSEYDEFSAYCRHRSALIKRLRLTKFRIGDRVHLTRPHSGLPKGVEVGYVIGASFYDTDIYPDDIDAEIITVRFDTVESPERLPAGHLWHHEDEANKGAGAAHSMKLYEVHRRYCRGFRWE